MLLQPEFCNFPDWNRKLANLAFEKIFKFKNREEAENVYRFFSDTYYKSDNCQPVQLTYGIDFLQLPSFNYIKDKEVEHVGIDLPIYFNYNDDSLRIMIVGIDPLRSGEEHRNIISLGTPYNFHNSQSLIYWRLVEELIERLRATVYLTDTFKLYFTRKGQRSYNIPEFTNPNPQVYGDIHQSIFSEEIKIVNPDLIVTLGTFPRVWFTNVKKGGYSYKDLLEISENENSSEHNSLSYNDIPVISLMHLSPSVRSNARLSNYGVQSNDDIINKYISIIEKRVSKIPSTHCSLSQ